MRSRLAVVALAHLTVATVVAGCFLITGSTSGYTQATPEGGCEAAVDCTGEGGPQVCCLSAMTVSSMCQARCGALEVQLCAGSTECASASCLAQSCRVDDAATFQLRACGKIPGCVGN